MNIRTIIWLALLLWPSRHVVAQDTAQDLFSHNRSALFQIQIIELSSGNKSSIGSGFVIDADEKIVTNYHVISDYVYAPEKYRMEMQRSDGSKLTLHLIDFDVVNDLAVVKADTPLSSKQHFVLAEQLPSQGVPIYSLGNPHDLGMIVVPGTYNGLKKNSFYSRIHFTGSINPGMSGGPAVNAMGDVIGVNVATSGNSIGFLVPLPQLKRLLENINEPLQTSEHKVRIQQQLLANQEHMLQQLMDNNWTLSPIGEALVPKQVSKFMSCWGDSNSHDKTAPFFSIENRCGLLEKVFLNRGLQTGAIEIEFEWLDSQAFNRHRFANFFTHSITGAGPGNNASKSDVTNFTCQDDVVTNQHGVKNKVVLCIRAYKDFPKIFDALFVGASLQKDQQGLISHFTLAGMTRESIQTFTKRFMEVIEWQ